MNSAIKAHRQTDIQELSTQTNRHPAIIKHTDKQTSSAIQMNSESIQTDKQTPYPYSVATGDPELVDHARGQLTHGVDQVRLRGDWFGGGVPVECAWVWHCGYHTPLFLRVLTHLYGIRDDRGTTICERVAWGGREGESERGRTRE